MNLYPHHATCYNGGNLPSPNGDATRTGSPVAYGGKPSCSAGFTATQWLL